MKKLITGIIVAILPLYSFISWINIFNNAKLDNQESRVTEYRKVFFNLIDSIATISLLNISLSIVAIYLFSSNFNKKGH